MKQKMTWEEMKKAYPDEWLLITDYKLDQFGRVASGVVERHSKDDQEVFQPPAPNKSCAFEYTGEYQFPGGLRAHADHNHF
ncbi:MAG: hypothetical protein A3F82_05030 [Deltaproteobacteria bacterium RIFCSPLOWO2_12_FULL_44_12]|nr:MAG: hypothetical protein A2712_06080 [Deltaproteobacteria bacterium RIFCSPHIGHO2_01_FULL_43_49]OGQ16696.1 MAG: hypothetical protein A3D22_07205 [Deltaproteobacteria bacterium RIFCSPHIGHO2_02_FULL_44_53]OGQ29834.1 MAG: hypothetical protein A3D98_09870 [Deltaproteobacteria bacterium RIFCSPHIGHO2_12_FULL_44_21]OGQ33124.1 MAG: hypothetical protein A2979_03850 [Deltaproteobacteria bacterium RIFCSPLOWO2_01_FULL_45_74]OGQ42219.1 MAG: hypothetical protein A3I70_06155 [Deltaproteobacteria bacterium 